MSTEIPFPNATPATYGVFILRHTILGTRAIRETGAAWNFMVMTYHLRGYPQAEKGSRTPDRINERRGKGEEPQKEMMP